MATGDLNAQTAGAGFEQAWRTVRADADIQFAPAPPPSAPETPDWLRAVLDFLQWLADSVLAPVADGLGITTRGVLIGLAVVLALTVAGLIWRWLARRAPQPTEALPEQDWTPDAGDARALLEDADRLAAEGQYDAATHLLLRRAISQIESALPGLIAPSSTAREIAAAAALPPLARQAFATIAARVERSLFALRRLEAEDWRAARAAYADFALSGAPATEAAGAA